MRLGARIEKLEEVAAPIKADQERRRENQQLRTEILRDRKDVTEEVLSGYRYVFGDSLDEDETTKDIIEIDLLYHTQATDRFGVDENGYYKATPEQLSEVSQEVTMRFDRHFFGNYQTGEQYKKEQWMQAKADMAAGVATAESEAAEYIRQLFKRYPRKLDAEQFYSFWE